ncbi:MAG: hypothetical protein MUE97_04470 [Phycisphaerales bacterium]|jgi:hypothetical protein|nr:hypothetical protein [Phycisphaerales bacterium]
MSETTGADRSASGTRVAIGLAVLAVALFVVIVLGWWAWWATAPMRMAKMEVVEPISEKDVLARRSAFGQQLASAGGRLVERSPFAPPKPPEPEKPKIPPRYAGPAVVGVAGGQVFFADGKRIAVGVERDGIKVLSLDAPWSVRLGWSGGEYDVTLLERRPVRFDEAGRVRDTLFR